ncbi:MAG: hypothetical protein AB7T49_19690 [Oligoflexales bacterium]
MKRTLFGALIASCIVVVNCKPMEAKKQRSGGAEAQSSSNQGPGKFAADFKQNGFFSLMSEKIPGKSPHGKVKIWYSNNIRSLIDQGSFEAPVGTVSIKEFENEEGTGLAIMIKKDRGYDGKNRDWYYEMRGSNGELMQEPAPGKVAMCIGCHSAASATDYLAGTKFGIDTTPTVKPTNEPRSGNGPGKFLTEFKNSAEFFTNMKTPYMGTSPHKEVQIWYSANVRDLIKKSSFAVPPGTVSIKEFNNDGKAGHDGVAVMIKKEPGYDSENNDWYYEMRDMYGAVMKDPAPGKIQMCISCHAAGKSTDYLAGTKLDSSTSGSKGPGSFVADYASSSQFFTQMSGEVDGKSPHGRVQIWYSANVKSLISSSGFKVPEGTVAVKRFHNAGGSGLAVMVKKAAGYDSSGNDWYYEMRDSYGNVMSDPAPGKIEMCRSCHAAASAKDYLAGTGIK